MKHQSPDRQIKKFKRTRYDYSFGRRRYDSSIKKYGNTFLVPMGWGYWLIFFYISLT